MQSESNKTLSDIEVCVQAVTPFDHGEDTSTVHFWGIKELLLVVVPNRI